MNLDLEVQCGQMNPSNGKGSAPRKGRDDKKYSDNWDKIFGVKSDGRKKDHSNNGSTRE